MEIFYFIIIFILTYSIGFVIGKFSLLANLRHGDWDYIFTGEKEFDKLQEGLNLNSIYEERRRERTKI
jgi:hypothetical protein